VKPAEIAVPRPSIDERLQRLREEWQHHQSSQAKALFEEMPEAEKAGHLARFEEVGCLQAAHVGIEPARRGSDEGGGAPEAAGLGLHLNLAERAPLSPRSALLSA